MIIPYRVDVPLARRPLANYIIIAATIGAFIFQITAERDTLQKYVLDGFAEPAGLLGYMFLHGNPLHLLGNMLFLWVFGNAVCAKLGNGHYAMVYLLLGLVAGLTHIAFGGGPCVGASGAINGIIGMYLLCYPLNDISCVFFLFFMPRTFHISSYWMILLWFAFDILGAYLGGTSAVAYYSHIGGFLAGMAVAIVLLKTHRIKMDPVERSLLQVLGLDKIAGDATKNDDRYITGGLPIPPPVKTNPDRNDPDERFLIDKAKPKFIRFSCRCGQNFSVSVELAGKKSRCPKCSKIIIIPKASSVSE